MSDSKEDDRMAMNQKNIKYPVSEAERKNMIREASKEAKEQYNEALRKLSKN